MITKENVRRIINNLEFCQAWIDGKDLQFISRLTGEWEDGYAGFGWELDKSPACYRVKPEPVTITRWAAMNVHDNPPCFIADFPDYDTCIGFIRRNGPGGKYRPVELKGEID